MTTLREAHTLATRYWDTKGGTTGPVMAMRAEQVIKHAGLGWGRKVSSLTASDGTRALTGLHKLSVSSRASYYAAFRRMLALAGVSTVGWPQAGHAPRRVREPMPREAAESLQAWFATNDMPESADLVTVLLGTGMRVKVEALSFDAWQVAHGWVGVMPGCGPTNASVLRVTGKGGHERLIPINPALGVILTGKQRMQAMRRLSYSAHMKRWKQGVEALGIQSKLPTPHSLRHLYATEAYRRSGCNLHVVKELLGHADINTTARYIGVNMEELRHAAGA
jgi:integrase